MRGDDGQVKGCPTCTDTIMVLTVDPVTKTAGMLSIPRDMWVNIPGAGYSRINTAWAIGENAKLPGGPLNPLAQGDAMALMQSDQARI